MKIVVNVEKYIKLCMYGEKLNSYHQRLFLGATALPLIGLSDYFTAPDKKTLNNSISRTWAKIIVGTATGVIVRFAGYKAAQRFADAAITSFSNDKVLIKKTNKKFGSLLFPKKFMGEVKGNKDKWDEYRDNYHKALGIYLSIGAMVFTNFLIDLPLTNKLANFLRKNVFNSDKSQINIYETPKVKQSFAFASKRLKVQSVLRRGEEK